MLYFLRGHYAAWEIQAKDSLSVDLILFGSYLSNLIYSDWCMYEKYNTANHMIYPRKI